MNEKTNACVLKYVIHAGIVPALRKPDTSRRSFIMACMGFDGNLHLCLNTGVEPEKRKITVSCAAGDDIDDPFIL